MTTNNRKVTFEIDELDFKILNFFGFIIFLITFLMDFLRMFFEIFSQQQNTFQ